MVGIKVSILGPKIGKMVFLPLIFLGGTYEHPYRRQNISGHTTSCGKVSQKSAQGRQKTCGEKKKITRPKYNSLRLSL